MTKPADSSRKTALRLPTIDPGVRIGHVHLKVADLQRALDFYCGVLGFTMTTSRPGRRLHLGRRLPPPSRAQHLGEPGRLAARLPAPPAFTIPPFCTRPGRCLADALRRLIVAKIPLEGASDHGVSEALYLRDPDDNGVELYWDRPKEQWPKKPDGSLADVHPSARPARSAGASWTRTSRQDRGAVAAATASAAAPAAKPPASSRTRYCRCRWRRTPRRRDKRRCRRRSDAPW